MAHNLQIRDIQVATEMAWHGKSVVRKTIDLDNVEIGYDMATTPLFIETSAGKFQTDFKQVISLDDNLPCGNPVGSKYSLISNKQLLEMAKNALSGFKHEVVSVGTVNNRSLVFISISLKDNAVVKAGGDKVQTVLNILSGHGGVMPVIARSSMTRVVCQNTFNQALGAKGEFNFRIKHTLNGGDKLEGMEQAIDAFYGITAEFKLAMNDLATKACDNDRATRIVSGMLGEGDKMSTRTVNQVSRIVELYRGGAGNKGETLHDVFNGITDFYSHESASTENTWKQYVSSEFGAAGKAKREAYSILTDDSRVREVEAKGATSLALSLAQ